MAFPQGINFRASAGFVTDGANEDYCLSTTSYPTTSAQGNSIGWEDSIAGLDRDRNSGIDRRLAGICFVPFGGGTARFRVDLPSSGNYNIRIAAGDAGSGNHSRFQIKDTDSVVLDGSTDVFLGLEEFVDASLTTRTSAADWVTNNAAYSSASFATTICRVAIINASSFGASVIAHFYIESAGGGIALMGQICT